MAKQASQAQIHLLAERIRARVAAHAFDLGNGIVLAKTCSIGFAAYPFVEANQPQPRWEDVVAMADQCLYAAKAGGRDMWVGVVQCAEAGAAALLLDVPRAVQAGLLGLQHSEGRTIVWTPAAH